MYVADLVPTAAHVPALWGMAYDIEPLKTIQEKERLLARAADEGWRLVFEHDPTPASARVARTAKGIPALAVSVGRLGADRGLATSGGADTRGPTSPLRATP